MPMGFSRGLEPYKYRTAATCRSSPTNTLNVRAAAAVSMTSSPMPRRAIANTSSRGGNTFVAPVPSTMTSGRPSRSLEKSFSRNSTMSFCGQPSITASAVSAIVRSKTSSPMQILPSDTLRIVKVVGISCVNFKGAFRYHQHLRIVIIQSQRH